MYMYIYLSLTTLGLLPSRMHSLGLLGLRSCTWWSHAAVWWYSFSLGQLWHDDIESFPSPRFQDRVHLLWVLNAVGNHWESDLSSVILAYGNDRKDTLAGGRGQGLFFAQTLLFILF